MNEDDVRRLAFEVRRFLGMGGWLHQISGMAKLYLEFPDVSRMYDFHKQLMLALSSTMIATSGDTVRRIDDETVEVEIGGMSLILTCKQRFHLPDGDTVGYSNMKFNVVPPPLRRA